MRRITMEPGAQVRLAEYGEAGCFALCVVKCARPDATLGEAVDIITEGIARGFIHYSPSRPEDPDNMYVRKRGELFGLARGEGEWECRNEKPEYRFRAGETGFDHWEWRPDVSITYSHFRLPGWDPKPGSRTVANGRLVGKRVFWRKR